MRQVETRNRWSPNVWSAAHVDWTGSASARACVCVCVCVLRMWHTLKCMCPSHVPAGSAPGWRMRRHLQMQSGCWVSWVSCTSRPPSLHQTCCWWVLPQSLWWSSTSGLCWGWVSSALMLFFFYVNYSMVQWYIISEWKTFLFFSFILIIFSLWQITSYFIYYYYFNFYVFFRQRWIQILNDQPLLAWMYNLGPVFQLETDWGDISPRLVLEL